MSQVWILLLIAYHLVRDAIIPLVRRLLRHQKQAEERAERMQLGLPAPSPPPAPQPSANWELLVANEINRIVLPKLDLLIDKLGILAERMARVETEVKNLPHKEK